MLEELVKGEIRPSLPVRTLTVRLSPGKPLQPNQANDQKQFCTPELKTHTKLNSNDIDPSPVLFNLQL